MKNTPRTDLPGNIEKRIRRHIIGKPQKFLLSTLPGLENLCREELASLGISAATAGEIRGGIEFDGRVHDCYLANLKLRLANRILMRISTFRATNFRQLRQKAAALPWELYLPRAAGVDVRVASRRSRLFHTDAVADIFREIIGASRPALSSDPNLGPPSPQRIYVRAVEDRLVVSIDSSGDLLYKRGLKIQGGRAPIRETFAAAILTLCGYRGDKPLVDPMCGAGTFSLEGAMVAANIPAGWYRQFAFMNWPCFKPSRWNFFRREAQQQMTVQTDPIIFASDTDAAGCQALAKVVADHRLSGSIAVARKDFFDLTPADIGEYIAMGNKGLITINPPYGRRLGTAADSERLFMEICRKLQKDFTGWEFALLAPDRALARRTPLNSRAFHFTHGGLNIYLLTGKV